MKITRLKQLKTAIETAFHVKMTMIENQITKTFEDLMPREQIFDVNERKKLRIVNSQHQYRSGALMLYADTSKNVTAS